MNYKEGLKKVIEETTLSAGGTFGDVDMGNQGGNVGNVDFYAPGDARIPFVFGTDKKKKKKKKKKNDEDDKDNQEYGKPHIFRRAFVEESVEDIDPLIDGIIFSTNKTNSQLVEKIVKQFDVLYFIEEDTIYLHGLDDEIRGLIDTLYETIGPYNFCNNYYCLLGEFDYQCQLKEPKKRPEDYNQGQLRKGMRVELEHTPDKMLARKIAMHHLDEDEFYYDRLEKMESQFDEQPEQKQRQSVRARSSKTPV